VTTFLHNYSTNKHTKKERKKEERKKESQNKFMFSYGFLNGTTVFLLEGHFENADSQNACTLQVSDNSLLQNAV